MKIIEFSGVNCLIVSKKNNVVLSMFSEIDLDFISSYVWYLTDRDYLIAKVGKKQIGLHREILKRKLAVENLKYPCTHINGNLLDNRRENLDYSTISKSTKKKNELGIKGIYYDNKKGYYLKDKSLGYFQRLDEAIIALQQNEKNS